MGYAFGIYIDNRLCFDYHVSQLSKKVSKKLQVLARKFKCVETSKRRILLNFFITSQFSYYPLIFYFMKVAFVLFIFLI